MDVAFEQSTLAVLHACDAVVAGGSFGGVAAAVQLARRGLSVTLIEPRTYLGREMTATLRPWLCVDDPAIAPELIRLALDAAAVDQGGGSYAFNLDTLKIHLEDVLLAAGVKLLYASLLTGVETRDGEICGVIIGNKSGRQFIRCRLLIDATETALAAQITGAILEPVPRGDFPYRRRLEYTNVGAGIDLNAPLTIDGQQLTLHRGYRDQGHVLVECPLTLPFAFGDGFSLSARETAARHVSMAIAAALARDAPAFESAYLAGASYELYGMHAPRFAASARRLEWTRSLADVPLATDLNALDCAGNVRGLWYLNESVSKSDDTQRRFYDPVYTSEVGAALGRFIAQLPSPCLLRKPSLSHASGERDKSNVSRPLSPSTWERGLGGEGQSLQIREPYSPQRGFPYERVSVSPPSLPVVREVDVLVVGGGTSGAVAAITAAGEGVRVALVEMNPGLGGTSTYGGVHSYWFGRRIGFSEQMMRLITDMHVELKQPPPKGLIPKWNIEAKGYALLKEAEARGAELLFNSYVIGVLVEGDAVRGVVVATRAGATIIRARVVIDASGDGDAAAFAGADYVYGDERDHITMWYALAQFTRPGLTRNHFTSMVDVSNVEDYTRAILAGRRRGRDGDMHDHGIYVAPRESRHIKADIVLTLTDQLRQRRWDDVVNVAFSNHDVKGHTGSDWLRIGLIPPNLEIEIPYRALLPRGLENILVVGKAFSATHDALPAIRMQADLENLGGVAGIAAAQVVRGDHGLREIDIKRLQARLVDESILPPDVLTRQLEPIGYTDAELRQMIDTLPADKPLIAYSDMELTDLYEGLIPLVEICCAGERVIPLLKAAIANAQGARRVLLAQTLALVGSTAGVPALIEAIDRHLQGDRLPARTEHIRYTQLPPDHGAMPEVVYLLYSLGMTPDERALPIWRRVVDLLAHVTETDFYEELKGVFYYVDAVCYAAERLAHPALIPLLKSLHSYSPFHGKTSYGGFQPDYIQERLAYLELVIGRALARCGSVDGLVILISYLRDNRALLAEHAHTELVAITGQDFGKDVAAWNGWLEFNGESLPPLPYRRLTDPMQAWGEVVQTIGE